MPKGKRVLFICEGNRHRSPTAEKLYSSTPGIKTRSAGLSDLARVQVTDELLAWADLLVVMDQRLRKMLRRQFATALLNKEMVCLEVPDDFQFGQPDLIAILTERLVPILGQPLVTGSKDAVPAPDPARDAGS